MATLLHWDLQEFLNTFFRLVEPCGWRAAFHAVAGGPKRYVCPECHGTGKQLDKKTGKPTDEPCERCDGRGKIVEGIG